MRTYYFIHNSVPIAIYYGGQAGAQLGTEVGALTSLEADGRWFFLCRFDGAFRQHIRAARNEPRYISMWFAEFRDMTKSPDMTKVSACAFLGGRKRRKVMRTTYDDNGEEVRSRRPEARQSHSDTLLPPCNALPLHALYTLPHGYTPAGIWEQF